MFYKEASTCTRSIKSLAAIQESAWIYFRRNHLQVALILTEIKRWSPLKKYKYFKKDLRFKQRTSPNAISQRMRCRLRIKEVAFIGLAQVRRRLNSKNYHVIIGFNVINCYGNSNLTLWMRCRVVKFSHLFLKTKCDRWRPPPISPAMGSSGVCPTSHSQTLPYMGIKRIVSRHWTSRS